MIMTAVQNIKASHHFPAAKQKRPITIKMLEQIKKRCKLSDPHHALFWCIASVAFHTLSRLGELVVSNNRRIAWAIRLANVEMQLEAEIPFVIITPPRTKVHNPSTPEFILIRATHDAVCPLEAFTNYMKIRKQSWYAPKSTGLFVLSNGALASRNWFLGGLKQILPDANVAGQSFRAGGATHLAMRGAPRLVIQRLGRWNSNTFEQYIRTQPEVLVALSEAYTNSNIAQSLLNRRPATPHRRTDSEGNGERTNNTQEGGRRQKKNRNRLAS